MISVRFKPLVAVGAVLLVVGIGVLAVMLLSGGNGDGGEQGNVIGGSSPGRTVESFMASDAVPVEVKERFQEALDDGDLSPEMFHAPSASWSACNVRCVGRVKEAGPDSLTLVAVRDGSDWSIGIGPATRVLRRGDEIEVTDLQEGEVVEALSQTGEEAEVVISYAE